MKITIVGAGNAGCAHACKLTESGHEVTLLKTSTVMHNENFSKILAEGIIRYYEPHSNIEKIAKPSLITHDFKEALDGAEIVIKFFITKYFELVREFFLIHF